MRLLFIGDIYGRPGRRAVSELLPELKKSRGIDAVVACVENASGGRGMNRKASEQLFAAGIDVMTTGNHAYDQKEIFDFIDDDFRIVRACNLLPANTPGRPFTVVQVPGAGPLGVVQANGRVFMEDLPNPFLAVDEAIKAILAQGCKAIVVDFHAEATSEKTAMGWHLNGRVSAVVGTHTHVQTADETILSGGTAYITDVGMTGPHDSVIGANKEKILRRFVSGEKAAIEVANRDVKLCAVEIDIEPETGRARRIERLRIDHAVE